MYQFCYVSKTTSSKEHFLPDLTNILNEARTFNYQQDLTGVLYYSDGYFFQCLEGTAVVLNQLLEKLLKDSRHQNIQVFEWIPIDHRSFGDWMMKYVSSHSDIVHLCREMGFKSFNPYLFRQRDVIRLLDELKILEADLCECSE